MQRDAVCEFPGGARLRLIPFSDIKVGTERNYLVKGLSPRTGLIVVWGPPKCGKSFWAFDLAMHVALDREYRGRRVVTGPVVYVAAEGAEGLKARIEAFRQNRMADAANMDVPFYLIPDRLALVDDHQELAEAIRNTIGSKPPVAVVLDTLNRTMTGSESSDEDMAAYIAAADTIRAAFECAVIIIHHCGIEGSRPRGHTSLTGAADAQLAVKRDAAGTILVTVEWMKDGPEGDTIASRLEAVEIAMDADGDPVTSCIVEPAEETAGKAGARLTPRQRRGLDVLHNALADHGKPAPDSRNYPPGAIVIKADLWRDCLFRFGVLDKDAANPRQPFKRLKDDLSDRGAIRECDGLIWAVRNDG
jgi:hypothetical protein